MGVWSDATNGYDEGFDVPRQTWDELGYVAVFHEFGVAGWDGPTGFYTMDIRAPLPASDGQTWVPIYAWADPRYVQPAMELVFEPDPDFTPPSSRAYTLWLLHVPEGVVAAPPVGTTWDVAPDAPLVVQLPTYTTEDGLTGYEFAFVISCVAGACACPGDGNCDGQVSWRDIDYFVAAMGDNVAAWEALFVPGAPACPFDNNDVNGDGTVSWRDIDPLVALMNTTCGPAVPDGPVLRGVGCRTGAGSVAAACYTSANIFR